jgi:C4-dicarboxylate-specific signal transduction histidine kinase
MLDPEALTFHLSGLKEGQLQDLLAVLDRSNQSHSMLRGVAHDLSNVSQALSMGAPAVLAGEIEAEKWLAMTSWVDDKMNRATAVLRDFGAQRVDEERSVLVHEVLRTAHDWQQLQRAQPIGHISWHASPDLPPVRASDRRLRQILLALIANAKEAIDGRQEAEISLEATPTANGVTIVVEDSGAGIDPDIRDKVFDAFFTTKDPELHAGLGLTVARESAESWGGGLNIDERNDGGTRAKLFLHYWSDPGSS